VNDIREKVLKDIEDEKNRLEREKRTIADSKNKGSEDDKNKDLNYENYFGIDPKCNKQIYYL
jgi:hypothetical protein